MTDGSGFQDIARRYGLALVLQFGSTVRGGEHERSDVDIGLLFGRQPPALDELTRITRDLQGLFPGRQVDVAVLDRADPLFLKMALEGARHLAGDPRRLAELELYAFKRYQDHRRYLDMEREHLRRFLKEA